jgi:hypothetical protein
MQAQNARSGPFVFSNGRVFSQRGLRYRVEIDAQRPSLKIPSRVSSDGLGKCRPADDTAERCGHRANTVVGGADAVTVAFSRRSGPSSALWLVTGLVKLGHDVARDAAPLVDLDAVGLGPLAHRYAVVVCRRRSGGPPQAVGASVDPGR